MKVEQTVWNADSGWEQNRLPGAEGKDAQLVILFGSTDILEANKMSAELTAAYPKAEIVGCGSGNEIWGNVVTEDTLVVTAVTFDKATLKIAKSHVEDASLSKECGADLVKQLPKEGLKHIFVLCDGIKIDGTKFVEGMVEFLPEGVGLTGGLSSDGARLERTPVYYDGKAQEGSAVAIGLYGDSLDISYACEAGWKAYGLAHTVTKSKNNILYELDNKPALQLYKEFIGPFANRLPVIGGLYPFAVTEPAGKQLSRTLYAINEEEQSIALCGGVPEGSRTQFMMTNARELIQGAESAATRSKETAESEQTELAFLLSCYARKTVLKQRAEEEVEMVRDILGEKAIFAGFYSYGEISPFGVREKCYLHNQTMAITTIREK